MAAAKIVPKYFANVGEVTRTALVAKATQNDWVVFPEAGVIDVTARNLDGSLESHVYGKVQVNNGGVAYTATSRTIAYDNAVQSRLASNYYAMTDEGEIVYVLEDDDPTAAAGNMTVVRGCLGTTAKADGVADGDWIYILNVLTLASAATTPTLITYKEITPEYNALMFD